MKFAGEEKSLKVSAALINLARTWTMLAGQLHRLAEMRKSPVQ